MRSGSGTEIRHVVGRTIVWVALLCLCGAAAVASGALNAGLGPTPDSVSRDTPRQTVVGFLTACRAGDLEAAAHHLDLSEIPRDQQRQRAPRLARRFKIVLDRTFWVDPAELADDPLGATDDGLPPGVDRLTVIEVDDIEVDILLERAAAGDGEHVWVFSGSTVRKIDPLYDEFGYGWLGDHLPEVFFRVRLWEVQLWQVCALVVLLVVGWVAARMLARPLLAALDRAVRRTSADWDDELAAAVTGPLRLGLLAAVLFVTANAIGLAAPVEQSLRVVWKLVAIFLLGWLVSSWVEVGARLLRRAVGRDQDSVAQSFIPIFARVAKVGLWALVFVVGLDAVGVRVMGLIAGLGIGGLAVAFAAQRTIENFFGALAIAADRPFAVGDFVSLGGMKGSVEEVGLRSTRIRTPARTVVTIPNGSLLSERVENFTARDRILYNPTLGLVYGTSPAQIELVIDEIKKLLLGHPMVFHENVRVRLSGFGDSSIDVEIFTWISTTDFHGYTAIAEELNLAIMRIIERAGTSFAFPSRTVYTAAEAGLDDQRARQAETIVAERRQRRELWLPEPPDNA